MASTQEPRQPGVSLISVITPESAVRRESRSFAPLTHGSLTFQFVTQARRELGVTLTARAIFDLNRAVVVGQRLDRVIRHSGGEAALAWSGRRTMQPQDLKRIDVQTLRHGVELLMEEPDGVGVVPAFWRTVTTSQGRLALLYAGLETEADPGLLLVELFGGAEDAPPRQIREIISHLEAQRRGVILHVSPIIDQLRRLAEAGPSGVAVDFAGVETIGARAWEVAGELIIAARATAPSVLLLNLPPDRGEAAAVAGATHAVFATMGRLTA